MGRAMVTSLWAWMGLALPSVEEMVLLTQNMIRLVRSRRTTYESGVALGFGGTRTFLTSGGIGALVVDKPNSKGNSTSRAVLSLLAV